MTLKEIEEAITAIDAALVVGGSKTLVRGLRARRKRLVKLAIPFDLEALLADFEARGRTIAANVCRKHLEKLRAKEAAHTDCTLRE